MCNDDDYEYTPRTTYSWDSDSRYIADILKHKAIISKYCNRFELNPDEKKEYDNAIESIDRIQNECHFHNYEIIEFPITVRKICKKCDYEDKTYEHFKKEKSDD